VLNPIFITNLELRGNIRLEKNRTAIAKDSSSKERRYSERMFIFVFLLVVARIFSHVFAKSENRVESLSG